VETHVISAIDSITIQDGIPPTGSTGGGGGGGGGDLTTTSTFHTKLLSSLRIQEIDYDVCTENIARILVSSDDSSLPTVTIQTKSGSVIATLADEQPFKELNIFTTIDKLLFEAPLEPDIESFTVHVDYTIGENTNSVSSTIQITDCEDIIAFEPETPPPLKQQKSGTHQAAVECKQDMFLAFKIDGSKSACVKPYTLDQLIKRGWASAHGDTNSWDVKPKTRDELTSFCGAGETRISGGYYKTQDSTLEFEWIKYLEDEEHRQGVQVRLHNPEEYKQRAYVYTDCSVPSIDSFEDCMGAGNPIMESYPRQCRTSDGKLIELIPKIKEANKK